MKYKYPEGIEITIQNKSLQHIKNDNIYYQFCQDNCVPRGNFKIGEKAILKHHYNSADLEVYNPNLAYYLDLSGGYISDWFSEKEIEHIAGGEENLVHPLADILDEKTNSEKPPLGVTPIYIFERQRIIDLVRAIYEYSHYGYINSDKENWDLLFKWADELKNRIEIVRHLES